MTGWHGIFEGFRIAVGALRANILRSALTTLGIVIGITTVTLMGWLVNGLNTAFLDSLSILGRDVLYVDRWDWGGSRNWRDFLNRKDITTTQANQLRASMHTARAVVPAMRSGSGRLRYAEHSISGVQISGSTEEALVTTGAGVAEGRFYNGAESEAGRNVVVLGSEIAANLFPHDYPVGKTIKVNDMPFEVLGVMEKQGSFLGMISFDNRIDIPIKAFQRLYPGEDEVTIAVKAMNTDDVEETRYELIGAFRKVRNIRPGAKDDFSVNQMQQFEQQTAQIRGTIYGVGLAIALLSLLVGGIGIMNIMFVTVTERTKEIGIRLAIGAPRRSILFQFLVEAAVLCLAGGVLAIGLASASAATIKYAADISFLSATIPVSFVVIAAIVSIVVGLIAGIIPAHRASRLDPVDSLRYE
jgi:putative ABC transport system permease protein